MPNRIDLLFSLIYKIHKLEGLEGEEFNDVLKEADKEILDTKKSVIFRYYYDMFEGKQGEELQIAVANAWKEVMTLFRTLDDWFYTPSTYNYIGLLSQCGEDISRLICYYNNMSESATQEDFIVYLKDRIKFYLKGVKRDDNGNIIHKVLDPERQSNCEKRGKIYQGLNFYYLGQKSGTTTRCINPYNKEKIVTDRAFRARSFYKRYAKDLGIVWQKNWSDDQKMHWENIPDDIEKQLRDYSKKMYNEAVKIDFPSKRKWAFVLGKDKRETRQLRKDFESRNKIYPYPND